MDVNDQRKISIQILKTNIPKFNLYTEFRNNISTYDDLLDIASLLEPYLNKHKVNYYELNLNTGEFMNNEPLMSAMINKISKLNPLDFEKVSSIICKCFKYNNHFTTKQSHDQGIDIIAYSNHFNDIFEMITNYKHFIFGQAKKFKNTLVNVSDIRELTGSITHFKNKEFSLKNASPIYKEFNIKSHTPVHALYTTSFFFSDSALNLCENSDIITVDIIDLSILFIKSLKSGTLDWFSGNKKFSNLKFKEDIKKVKIVS